MLKKLKLMLLLLVVLLTCALGWWIVDDNPADLSLVLLGFPLGILPAGLWLLIFLLTGVIAGILVCLPSHVIAKQSLRRQEKVIRQLKIDREMQTGQDKLDGKTE